MSLFHILVGAAALKVLAAKTPDKRDEEIDDIIEKEKSSYADSCDHKVIVNTPDTVKEKEDDDGFSLADRLIMLIISCVHFIISFTLFFKNIYSFPAIALTTLSFIYFVIIVLSSEKVNEKDVSGNIALIVAVILALTFFITGFFLSSFDKWLFFMICGISFFLLPHTFYLINRDIKLKLAFNFSYKKLFAIIFFTCLVGVIAFIADFFNPFSLGW